LFIAEPKHEVLGESFPVPFYLFPQADGLHAVELGEIGIKHDLLLPDQVDAAFDEAGREKRQGEPAGSTFVSSHAPIITICYDWSICKRGGRGISAGRVARLREF